MSYSALANGLIVIDVDLNQYSNEVVSKSCYWLSDTYIFSRESRVDNTCRITVERIDGLFNEDEFLTFRIKFSQSLADNKLREIIRKETECIRNILYIKAFSNNDEFEDYNFTL